MKRKVEDVADAGEGEFVESESTDLGDELFKALEEQEVYCLTRVFLPHHSSPLV